MDRIVEILSGLPIDFSNVYIAILRIIAPVLMAVILWRAGRPLLTFEKQPEVWANLILPRVIAEIAQLQGRTPEEVERVTAENAIGLYRLNHQ